MRQNILFAFISVLLLVVHSTIINVVTLGNAIPDILTVWLVYIAIVRGQVSATVAGFCIGFLVDIMSGNDGVMGLSALTKTLAGFTGGYFFNENKTEHTLSSWTFVFVVGLATLLHNAVYFIIFLQGTDVGWLRAVALHGIPSTLYTAALAVVPMSVFRRKFQ